MGLNLLNSANDPICPTYAAGSISLATSTGNFAYNNDSAAPGQPNGYAGTIVDMTVGSFSGSWNNGCHTQTVLPTYSNGLLSFGRTGRQS